MTPQQLAQAWDVSILMGETWAGSLSDTMALFDIMTLARQEPFVANVGHESGRGRYVREIWGPTAAQKGYEGRKDLGNVQPGDGHRFMGRGLLQTTGRANYAMTRDRLRDHMQGVPDFEANPQLLEVPRWAALSAGLFWHTKRINALADAGDFLGVCVKINGRNRDTGLPNGWQDRQDLLVRAKRALT